MRIDPGYMSASESSQHEAFQGSAPKMENRAVASMSASYFALGSPDVAESSCFGVTFSSDLLEPKVIIDFNLYQ